MAKKAAQDTTPDMVLQLKPEDILADDNIRHGAPRTQDVDLMMRSVVDRNGVQEPISVELITDPKKGQPKYRLLKGFIRHTAVSRLNKEQAAGLTLPALVRTTTDATDRLKAQVAENVIRASLSPMDTANSIHKLLDAGVPRAEIRDMFSRAGTSKGATVSPMSNAWLNIHLNMLTLPADVQAKIHNGAVTVEAARLLGKVSPDKLAAVLARAEGDVAAMAEQEQKDEDRYLKDEQAQAKETEKAEKAVTELADAKADIGKTEELVKEKLATLRLVQAEEYDPSDAKAKEAYSEKLKGAENDVKAAQGLDKKAKNKVAKLLGQSNKAEEVKERVAKARTAATPAVGPKDVKRAAKAEGAPVSTSKKLSATEMRDAVKDIGKSKNLAVQRVSSVFMELMDGVSTPKLAMEDLEKLLKATAVPAPKK